MSSPNIIVDPGAELDSPLWSYATGAGRLQETFWTEPFEGGWMFLTGGVSSSFAPTIEQGISYEDGEVYQVKLWVDGLRVVNQRKPLALVIDPGGEPDISKTHEEYTGWHLWDWGTFTATGTSGQFSMFMEDAQGINPTHYWAIDSIIVRRHTVAIKLAERGVDAVAAMLLAQMATELTAIETQRGDGITLEVPTAAQYYKRPHGPFGGTTAAHIEVYEESYVFDNPYSDAAVQRAAYELPLIVRLTYFNRVAKDKQFMVTQIRRYAAAMFNCFIRNYDLSDTDDSTKWAWVRSVDADTDSSEDGSGVQKITATLKVTVKCEEAYS